MIHELLQDQLHAQRSNSDRMLTKHPAMFARMISQVLFDAPSIHTGKCSIRLIEAKLKDPTYAPTKEHHHGRQSGGNELVDLVHRANYSKQDISRADVRDIVLKYCQVHYTTRDENAKLRKHQKQCSSEAAYRRANVVLVEAIDLFTKRSRKPAAWLKQMHDKYQPIVDEYNNPAYTTPEDLLELPQIIN